MLGLDISIVTILAILAVFASGLLLVIGFVPDEVDTEEIYGYRERKRRQLLDEEPLYELTLPLVLIFAHYIRKIPDEKLDVLAQIRRNLRDKLPRSGYVGAYSPDEFLGMCCTAALGTFLGILLLTLWLTGTPRVPLGLIGAGGAAFMPFLTLNSAVTERLIEIDQRLPYTMDLLVLSMNAGLDFMTALERVVQQGKEQNPDNPMIQELSVVLQELRVGTPRADALRNLCDRVHSDYLDSMVGAVIQAEKRGTPLATVLEVQVDTIRNKRSQRIEKEASQASVKILMPLMFIFGAVIVVILGAMVLRIYNRSS